MVNAQSVVWENGILNKTICNNKSNSVYMSLWRKWKMQISDNISTRHTACTLCVGAKMVLCRFLSILWSRLYPFCACDFSHLNNCMLLFLWFYVIPIQRHECSRPLRTSYHALLIHPSIPYEADLFSARLLLLLCASDTHYTQTVCVRCFTSVASKPEHDVIRSVRLVCSSFLFLNLLLLNLHFSIACICAECMS